MAGNCIATLVALTLAVTAVAPAYADNAMGYRLLDANAATQLPRGGGTLGLEAGRAQQITDGGLTFDVMGIKTIRPGSPAAKSGLNVGDDIIAVDGQVFPSIKAFAAYVGSKPPGAQIAIDSIPKGGGPQQAQRVSVTLGAAASLAAPQTPAASGMSTGEKLAIGAGAVALFGCYELGCFRRSAPKSVPAQSTQGVQPR